MKRIFDAVGPFAVGVLLVWLFVGIPFGMVGGVASGTLEMGDGQHDSIALRIIKLAPTYGIAYWLSEPR